MTKTEMLTLALAGTPVLVCEYRLHTPDEMKWIHKKTGKPMHAIIARHRVETTNDGFEVTEFMPDGTKIEDCKPVFKKGQKVVLVVENFVQNAGSLSARGQLHALEDSPAKP